MSADPNAKRVRVGSAEVLVRAADPDDRPRAREVQWAVGWKDAPSHHRTWPEADADWQARRYYRELVAEVDGIVAARVGLEAYRQPFAELIDLCVRPEFRRLGLGEMLTLEGERECAQRGFRGLFLQTELDNATAHRLYRGLDFVPTAHGSMLRMVKLIDCPLLSDFKRDHPLHRYTCSTGPAGSRTWILQWDAYVTEDRLCLTLEGGASRVDSEGCGPAITGCDWRVDRGEQDLQLRFTPERVRDIEAGHHVETTITVTNAGKRTEHGVFQMMLPPGIKVADPATNQEKVFLWQAAPGETITQPVVLQVEPTFDATVLHELNYGSVPVSVEVYWERRRVLLNCSLPFALPKP
jgi:ribosomal protein S18 acetylase RimI-like enzyme